MLLSSVVADLNSTLTHYYSFDTDLTDEKGNEDLTQTAGTISYTDGGVLGTGVYCSGDDILNNANPYLGTSLNYYSKNIWINVTTNQQQYPNRERSSGTYDRFYLDGSNLYISIHDGSVWDEVSTAYTSTTLHMLTMVWDGSNVVGYLDSVKFGNTTLSGSYKLATNGLDICGVTGGADKFDGVIDEFGVWEDYVLTQSDINTLYNSGNGFNPLTTEEASGGGVSNNDHIAFTDVTNITGSDSVYFNFTTNGNYSYTEWYQDNVLKANDSLKYHNFTGLNNVTYYLFNISIYWNNTLFNKTSYNISTLQSTQVNDFGSTNVTQLNDIHTKISYIYEVLQMLPLVLLYAIFMFMGYWLITSNNFYLGVLLLVNTIGFDFFFVRWIYTNYISGVNLTGWEGSFLYVFAISLIVWILVKLGTIIMVKSVRNTKV